MATLDPAQTSPIGPTSPMAPVVAAPGVAAPAILIQPTAVAPQVGNLAIQIPTGPLLPPVQVAPAPVQAKRSPNWADETDREKPAQSSPIQPQWDIKAIYTEAYSDKSIIVRGDGTRLLTDTLKGMNGKFVLKPRAGGLPGWVFSNKPERVQEVNAFLERVKAGQVQPDDPEVIKAKKVARTELRKKEKAALQLVTGTGPTLPIAKVVPQDLRYQTVSWQVYRPKKGMVARLNLKAGTVDYLVTKADEANGIVDTVYIAPKGEAQKTSRLIIASGQWQVWGFTDEHTITFV